MAIDIGSDEEFIFVIDTDKYAGNFERQMCAYTTGAYGECEVGKEESNAFEEEMEGSTLDIFNGDLIRNVPDEHGCFRPVTIAQSPDKKGYNSVAIFMSEKPNAEEFALLMKRAHKFVTKYIKQCVEPEKNINILGFRFLVRETTVNIDSQWDENGECKQS